MHNEKMETKLKESMEQEPSQCVVAGDACPVVYNVSACKAEIGYDIPEAKAVPVELLLIQAPKAEGVENDGFCVCSLSKRALVPLGRALAVLVTIAVVIVVVVVRCLGDDPDEITASLLAREIWADAAENVYNDWDTKDDVWADRDNKSYVWSPVDPCIQHPTFRGGSQASYTAMAVATLRVFRDARITQSVVCKEMPVNTQANIPMSSCGDLVNFSMQWLEGYSLVNETVSADLTAARRNLGFTC